MWLIYHKEIKVYIVYGVDNLHIDLKTGLINDWLVLLIYCGTYEKQFYVLFYREINSNKINEIFYTHFLYLVSLTFLIWYRVTPTKKKKKTEPIYFWLKFINLILAFSFFPDLK